MAVNIEHEDAAYSRQESLALAAENLGAAAESSRPAMGAPSGRGVCCRTNFRHRLGRSPVG
jgi:hypothetical protein